jgi:hypothetical protein
VRLWLQVHFHFTQAAPLLRHYTKFPKAVGQLVSASLFDEVELSLTQGRWVGGQQAQYGVPLRSPADQHTWVITVASMQQQQLFARLLVCLLACLLACLIACWGDGCALWVLQTSVIPHTQLLSGAVTMTTSTSSSRNSSCQLAS